jgi:hypothetical protein
MKQMITIVLLLLSCSTLASAQVTGPEPQRGEKWRGRPLPPSMQSEMRQLRARQGSRAIVYRDTVRASQLARAAFNDTTAEFDTSAVFVDSALSVVDSGVSLTHKEWLDSLLVEIPEMSRFSDRVDFNYPQSIQTEPLKKEVAIPSVDANRINPIPKENLPYFDQSPIPWTLTQGKRSSGYITAGGGNLHLPLVRLGVAHTLSDRIAFDLNGSFQKLGEASAIRDHYGVNALLTAELGMESAVASYRATALEVSLNVSGKNTDLIRRADSVGEHTLNNMLFGARMTGNIAKPLYYDISGSYGSFTESSPVKEREGRYNSLMHFTFDPGTDFRLRGDFSFDGAGKLGVAAPSSTLSANSFRLLGGQRSLGDLEWSGGLRFVAAEDAAGSRTRIMPQGFIRMPLNPRWEIGGSYEPRATVASNFALTSVNPFYSRSLDLSGRELNSGLDGSDSTSDVRRIVLDRFNVAGFMNYMLSADDQIRTEIRYIERDDEPVFILAPAFNLETDQVKVITDVAKTRRFIVSSSANFVLFKRDVVTAGFQFQSATDRENDRALPFEPTLKFTGAYSFNSIAPYLRPIAEFHYLSREDHAMAFINVGSDILFGEKISATIRVENLLNSQGDFWTGYNERPRAILGSLTYKF